MSASIPQIFDLYESLTDLSIYIANLCFKRETYWIVNTVTYVYDPFIQNEISVCDDISFQCENMVMQREITTYFNDIDIPDDFSVQHNFVFPTQQVPKNLIEELEQKVHLYNNLLGDDEILQELFGIHNRYVNHNLEYILKVQNYTFDEFVCSNCDTEFKIYWMFDEPRTPDWETEYFLYMYDSALSRLEYVITKYETRTIEHQQYLDMLEQENLNYDNNFVQSIANNMIEQGNIFANYDSDIDSY